MGDSDMFFSVKDSRGVSLDSFIPDVQLSPHFLSPQPGTSHLGPDVSHFLVEASQEDMGACDSCRQFSANRAIRVMVTFQASMGSRTYGTETTRAMPGCSGLLWHEGWSLDGSRTWKLESQKLLVQGTPETTTPF